MHGQHEAGHTNVSLLQIKGQVGAGYISASEHYIKFLPQTLNTCGTNFSHLKLNCICFIATYCFKEEEFNCTCETCHLILCYITTISNSTGLGSLLCFPLVPISKVVTQRVIVFFHPMTTASLQVSVRRHGYTFFSNLNILLTANSIIHAC